MKKIILSATWMLLLAACNAQESDGQGTLITKSPATEEEFIDTLSRQQPTEPKQQVVSEQKKVSPAKKKLRVKAEAPAAKPRQEEPKEAAEVVEGTPIESRTTDVVFEQVSAPAASQSTAPALVESTMSYGEVSTGMGNGEYRPIDEQQVASAANPIKQKNHFLPMHRRIDRGINQGHFAYKGELMVGLSASYGTMSSDDTDFMVILDNINLDGTIATVKPFLGYFYRDNRAVGVRFGYQHMGGTLGNIDLDLGDQNDISMSLGGIELNNNSYSFALFHRSYVGLDRRGRFGLFAEVEASMVTGTSAFVNSSGTTPKETLSNNFKAKLAFNPGLAVYIFPNVCTTVSIGLGGIQYTSVKQHDAEGNQTGSRKASKMQFRVNIADINLGVVVHLWDKRK